MAKASTTLSKFQTCVTSGPRPVMNELRDGLHTVTWAYARSKLTPRLASLLKLGVNAGLPYTCRVESD